MNITEKMIKVLQDFKSICVQGKTTGCEECRYSHAEDVWGCVKNHITLHADKEVYPRLMPMIESLDAECSKSKCSDCPLAHEAKTVMCCITQGIMVRYGMDLSEHLLDCNDRIVRLEGEGSNE